MPEISDEETQIGGTVSQKREPEPTPTPEVGLPPGMCPECGFVNATTNRFCASCGARIEPAAAAPKPKAAPAVEEPIGGLLVALDPEGNELGRYRLPVGETVVGRRTGGVFSGDAFLSPEHATFVAKGGKVTVRDHDSLNGVYRKLLAEQRERISSGQKLRIGQELLQYDDLEMMGPDDDGVDALGGSVDRHIGRVSLVVGRETRSPSVAVSIDGLNLGRERGTVLFPEDGYVSGLHCNISCDGDDVYVTDLGSSNGTFIQVIEETELRNGDILLMGQQLFRVTI